MSQSASKQCRTESRTSTLPLVAVVTMLLLFALPAFAAQSGRILEEIPPYGVIDWSALTITATGQGFPPQDELETPRGRTMARRAAQLDARRNLLEVFKNVRIDSQTLVQNFIVSQDVAVNRLAGVLERRAQESTSELSGHGIAIQLTVPLGKQTLQALRERGYEPPKKADTAESQKTATQQNKADSSPWRIRAAVENSSPDYNGVIIDARGLAVAPSLHPVFEAAFNAIPSFAPEAPPLYFRSIEAAMNAHTMGDTPLLLKAEKLTPSGSVVLSEQGVDTLHFMLSQRSSTLVHGAFAVVY